MGVLHISMASLVPQTPRLGRFPENPVPPPDAKIAPLARIGDTLPPTAGGGGRGPILGGQRTERPLEKTAEQLELERLVVACSQGDASAWQKLVVSQHRRVYGICYRFTGSPSDAEDLTQDVFLKVYRNLENFDATKGGFTTWLTTLTRNLLVDHFRRTRQERVTDSIDASMDGEDDGPTMADRLSDPRRSQHDQVAQMEMRARIQHGLKQMSPELREAVILRDLEDMDYKEISVVLNVPEGTVKSRISRGRAELARLLGRIEGQVV